MSFEKTQEKLDELRNLTLQNGKLVEALSQLSVNGLETELKQGKNNIVSAIKSKGVDASIDESMTSLADKITKIKEVEVKTLPAETSNVKANDLFNMVMKSQNWDSIYETVYENYVTNGGYVGVLMTALERGTRTSIALTGADAYYILEEDKFYTTDENRNLVTFLNGVETKLGTKNHLWDIDNAQYWRHVFYLYVEGSTADGSRENVHPSAFDYCNNSNIPNIQYKSMSGNFMHFHVSNPDTCNLKWNGGNTSNRKCYYFYTNVENANASWMLYDNQNVLTYVNFEALKKLTSGTLLQTSRVKKLDFPNLTEVTGGTLIYNCNALESVYLSNLATIDKDDDDKTEIVLLNSCNNLTELTFSKLEKVNIKKALTYACLAKNLLNLTTLKFPVLKECIIYSGGGGIVINTPNLINVEFPVLEKIDMSGYGNGLIATQAKKLKSLHLPLLKESRGSRSTLGSPPASENGYELESLTYIYVGCIGDRTQKIELSFSTEQKHDIDVEIGSNARQEISIKKILLKQDTIVPHIFQKLADNNFEDDGVTPAPALKITIGSNNLAKLTDEEKAIATDKNYILA